MILFQYQGDKLNNLRNMLITNIITVLLIDQARQVEAGQDTVQGKTRQLNRRSGKQSR